MNMQSENGLSEIRAQMLESHRNAISRGRMHMFMPIMQRTLILFLPLICHEYKRISAAT